MLFVCKFKPFVLAKAHFQGLVTMRQATRGKLGKCNSSQVLLGAPDGSVGKVNASGSNFVASNLVLDGDPLGCRM